jgi:LPXTG-motif cell wall-anchored protein
MTQHSLPPTEPAGEEKPPTGPTNTTFLTIVGVLLVMIIALLSGLWLRERTRAGRAEADLRRLVQAHRDLVGRNENLRAMAQGLLGKEALRLSIDRAGLQTRPVRLDGREVTALSLPADLAEAVGFAPGDVIVVEMPMTTTSTSPTTQP